MECFKCDDDSMCIDQALVCNGLPNCNDDSDEADSLCKPSKYNDGKTAADRGRGGGRLAHQIVGRGHWFHHPYKIVHVSQNSQNFTNF